jgi:hypothetical protein
MTTYAAAPPTRIVGRISHHAMALLSRPWIRKQTRRAVQREIDALGVFIREESALAQKVFSNVGLGQFKNVAALQIPEPPLHTLLLLVQFS